jgi:hypothetical protein
MMIVLRLLFLASCRALIALLPRDLRRRYGSEMLEVIADRCAEGRSPIAESLDLVRCAASARVREVGWMLVGGAAMHCLYASAVFPQRSMGGVAILLTATALLGGAAMVRRDSPRSPA